MDYKLFKLKFKTSVHFGRGGLDKASNVLCADTIFSALCTEAVKMGKLEELLSAVRGGKLLISDGLPYIGKHLYIPKPRMHIVTDRDGNSEQKKKLKNLRYIAVDKLGDFLAAELDIAEEEEYFNKNYGCFRLEQKVSMVNTDNEGNNNLYAVHTFTYGESSGLYICIRYSDEAAYMLLSTLLDAISYTGIGGKISSGYGKFDLTVIKPYREFDERLNTDKYRELMSLSICLPKDEELDTVLKTASYNPVKRSGFVASEGYANTARKKNDLYMFESGSVFRTIFEGDIYDVSSGGNHPVYRYGKPMLMGVR